MFLVNNIDHLESALCKKVGNRNLTCPYMGVGEWAEVINGQNHTYVILMNGSLKKDNALQFFSEFEGQNSNDLPPKL